jgi:hypothetical protein
MLDSDKFLTIRERRQFGSIATSWVEFTSHAHADPAKGQHWVTFRPIWERFAGLSRAIHSGGSRKPGRSGHAYPWSIPVPHTYFLPSIVPNQRPKFPARIELLGFTTSYVVIMWKELSISTNGPDNSTVLNQHRWDKNESKPHLEQPHHTGSRQCLVIH